ncbi:MAG: hypothetical protein KDA72_12230 [Planctomycetales bacterium]|nr:hypothetical protein [Planctomycetales bacterium]
MSKRPNGTMVGSILIALGMLLVALAFGEQTDRVNLGPNRFYTEADRDEFQSAHEKLHDLRKAMGAAPETGAENIPSSDDQTGGLAQQPSNEKAVAFMAADAYFASLKQKQDNAFRNQEILSLTLKSIGIACLAIGAILLMRVSRANRAAKSADKLAPVESSGH